MPKIPVLSSLEGWQCRVAFSGHLTQVLRTARDDLPKRDLGEGNRRNVVTVCPQCGARAKGTRGRVYRGPSPLVVKGSTASLPGYRESVLVLPRDKGVLHDTPLGHVYTRCLSKVTQPEPSPPDLHVPCPNHEIRTLRWIQYCRFMTITRF